jgi:two-component system, response regulator PdtaR
MAAASVSELCDRSGGVRRRRYLATRQQGQDDRRGREPKEKKTVQRMAHQRIVIVEDDVFIRFDLMNHLMAAGHAVVGTAGSAAEALEAVEREQPDLVLMDVRLIGEGDGIEAATEIWQRFKVRSLFISANLDAAARARAAAANPLGFLEKPFTPSGLLAALAARA